MNKNVWWWIIGIVIVVLIVLLFSGAFTGAAIFARPINAHSCSADDVCETNSLSVQDSVQIGENNAKNAFVLLKGENNSIFQIEADDGLEIDSSSYISLNSDDRIDLRAQTYSGGVIYLGSNRIELVAINNPNGLSGQIQISSDTMFLTTTNKLSIYGNVTLNYLSADNTNLTGSDYVCVNRFGDLFRSNSPC